MLFPGGQFLYLLFLEIFKCEKMARAHVITIRQFKSCRYDGDAEVLNLTFAGPDVLLSDFIFPLLFICNLL